MEFDYVILGGGVAGLCAAQRLLELGIRPLIIEAGSYPSHKVCGEFLSPSSLSLLKKWNIHPISIHHVHLHTSSQHFQLTFPESAGSLSHWTLDSQLANQISQQGAILLTQTKVLDLSPPSDKKEHHHLFLSSGEKVQAKHLLIATGRLPGNASKTHIPRYIGIKAHFTGIELNSSLHMFSFKGAYLGLAPVENGFSNLACLAKIERVQQAPSHSQFIQDLIKAHPLLHQLIASGKPVFDNWMSVFVPEFGLKTTPHWPRTYWIGDAAGTIPPASGNGLSLAIAGGYLAAEFAKRNDASGFKRAWKKHCTSQITFAKGLHQLFLHPSLASTTLRLSQWFPSIATRIFELTRDPAK